MQSQNIKVMDFPQFESSLSYELYPVSLSGKRYDLNLDFIHLSEGSKINFSLVQPIFIQHVKALISHVLSKNAEITVHNYFKHVKRYFRVDEGKKEGIEESLKIVFMSIINDKSIAPETKSYLRNAYRFFAEQDMPYFDQDFVDFYLDEIVLGSGNKGLDVIIQMKNRGCLTISEQREFKEKFTTLDIKQLSLFELQGYIALKIGQLTGARDCQVRRLKVSNFVKEKVDGNFVYSLKIPRAKQRGQVKTVLVKRPITKKLGSQIEFLLEKYKQLICINDNFYLLCHTTTNHNSISNKILSPSILLNRISRLSSRLGIDFIVNLRRLRKTFCSSLIARGVSKNIVAFLMDHSDLQQIDVYYRQTHALAKKLNQVLLKEAGSLLDAFAGKVIKIGQESIHGQALFAPVKDSKLIKIGSCGSGKACVLNPPLSCYGCKSLEAFEDVDHSEVLDQLLLNAQKTFGEKHALELAQNKHYLAAGALIKVIEGGEYE
tara:strand:+ start:7784 stop:9253 length:1470 start_codon:yes stop_codon:yes gene_type:complete